MVYYGLRSALMARTTAQHRVCVVDDDFDVVRAVRIMLTKSGYTVSTCLDPLDALALCEVGEIDVLITDWHMPGFSGLELLEVLQQKHPQVGRVLLTAAPHEPEVRQAVREGLVQALVEKPYARVDLVSAVKLALAAPP